MRAYRFLLRLFPAPFRAEYESEMCAVFEARRGRENRIALWASTALDIARNAFAAHADLLWQDLRWTFRTLRQSPGFTLTAIAVAALGMGANTAAFTLLDHVLLRPLPFPDSGRIVELYQTRSGDSRIWNPLSPPNYLDWRAMSRSFESFSAFSMLSINMSGEGDPLRLEGANIGSDALRILGARPALGRTFTLEDERSGTSDSVLLSDRLWRTAFGADPGVLGRTIRLDDAPYTIVGVMPPSFAFPTREAQLWLPLRFPPLQPGDRANLYLSGLARLRRGVSIEQARAELSTIADQLARAYPKEDNGVGVRVLGIRDIVDPQSRLLVFAVFGAAFCVLLIACSNLANLLLARGLSRRREIAVRMAIGAGRERLLRQLLTENLTLAILGGLGGLLLAAFATPALARLVPEVLPVNATPQLNLRVFVVAAALTLASSLIFGVVPAVRACSRGDAGALQGRNASGIRSGRLRAALVMAEVTATGVLLIAAGLLLKALWQVQGVDPGFRSDHVLTMRTALPMPKYSNVPRRDRFYASVLDQVRALPGVESASYISFLPMVDRGGIWPVKLPGMSDQESLRTHVAMRFVTPDFFKTLRIPLREGRDVSDSDTWRSPFVAVVSESFAKQYWPGQDPIGRHFELAFFDRTVIGVAGDIAFRGLEAQSDPQVYLASQQMPNGGVPWFAPKDLVVHSSGSSEAYVPAIRRIILSTDPEQAIADVQPLEAVVAGETATRQAQLRVLGAFAVIAFLLAAIGIHGLLSFAVSTRTQEVGVRMALGASRSGIGALFLRQALALAVGGLAIAIPLAYAAARSLASILFGVEPGDPAIYAAVAVLALAMTLAGSLAPALRAAAIDPAITIRSE